MQRGVLVTLLLLAVMAVACGDSGYAPPTIEPTDTPPLSPTATSTPVYEGSLRRDAWAKVRGVADCLEFRFSASTEPTVPVNYCQPNGYEGYVADGPMYSEGRWWWAIAGQGWAEHRFLQFLRGEDLSKRVVPELRELGQIAFIGSDGDLWVMNADGSTRRRLVDIDPASGPGNFFGIGSPQWRPDGQQLLYEVVSYTQGTQTYQVRIVDLRGHIIREIPQAASAFWSPDGKRLGLLYNILETGLGVLRATPAVLNLETDEVVPIGPALFYEEGPKWRPNSQELVYENEQGLHLASADGSGSRLILPPTGRAGHVPNWSPDGSRLSLEGFTEDCRGYIVYRIDPGQVELCAPLPPLDTSRGGRGGWVEDGQTDWGPDGRLFAYHTEWAVVNMSGVYAVDAITGEQTLLPGWKPAYTSFAPDSRHVVFETHGVDTRRTFIWVGDVESGEVILLAEGSQPAWRPAATD